MLKPPPCCASPEFAGPVTDGGASTGRTGADVGVTAGAGALLFKFAVPDVWALSTLGLRIGVGFGVAAGAATLPVADSLLLFLRRPPVVRGRSASPPPRTARPGVLVFVLVRAISTGVGRGVGAGRAGVGCVRACICEVRTGVVVVLEAASAGVDCARGVGVTTGAGVRVPTSFFAV